MTRAGAFILAFAGLALMACGGRGDPNPPPTPVIAAQDASAPRAPFVPHAVLPSPAASDYAPSAASVRDHTRLPPDGLVAIERCEVCHADVFAQWSSSAHRFSSLDNPFYLPAFEAAREARGAETTRWCGGCHDPALLFAGDLDGTRIDRTHERARLGVGCLLCHSVDHVHDRTGNGNYALTSERVVYPPREGEDRAAVEQHKRRLLTDTMRSAEFCAACHKVGITEAINGWRWLRGQNDFDPWDQSAWAGNDAERYDPDVPRRTCQDCHMPLEPATRGDRAATDGMVRSHRFAGGHTTLAVWANDPVALERERAVLRGAVRLDVFHASPTDGSARFNAAPLEDRVWTPGEEVFFDVVMVNERVGHRFPAGTADVADTWLEVSVLDALGHSLAQSGALKAEDPGPLRDDAHRLEVKPVDEQGQPALMRDPHRYRGVVYDTTIPPRASRVVRYSWRVPAGNTASYTVRVRLLHRRLARPYYDLVCRRAPGDQGRPCPTQPVTEVAAFESVVGSSARWTPMQSPDSPRWRRFYDHGRALVEWNVQERVAQASASLDTVVREAPERAEGYVEMARLAIRQGRTEDAYHWLDEAGRRAPDAPVVPYLRGVAASDVWRWPETVAPLERAHTLAPGNVRIAEMLANSLGIANRHRDAWRVITEGLVIDPERAQLHNLQALELRGFGAPEADIEAAQSAWLRFRTPDELPRVRSRCKRDVPGCARETEPLHVHALRPPSR